MSRTSDGDGKERRGVSAGARAREVTIGGRGHAAIRGTHAKTLELVSAAEITARATCVVGVAVETASGDLAGFVGPVSIRLRAGGHEDVVHALANPRFQPGDRLVVRCSGHRSGETFAVDADRGAAGLDRGLVTALGTPGARLEVTVRQETPPGERGAGLLTVLALGSGETAGLAARAAAELRAGGLLVALDQEARRAASAAAPAVPSLTLPDGLARCLDALAAGERVVLVGARETPGLRPPGRELLAGALAAGTPLQAVGLPAELAALVLSGLPGERLVLGGRLGRDRAARATALAAVAAGATGVWSAAPGPLASWIAEVEARLTGATVAVVLDPGGPGETVLRGGPAAVRRSLAARRQAGSARRASRGDALVVVAPPREPPAGLPAELAGLLAALLRAGVPARTLAGALAGQPGWSRREAYAAVLSLKGAPAG
jgi:16S rRNA C1402 (ribose-2'-O) methylase RsmI